MGRFLVAVIGATALISGCAAPPPSGTPGTGEGAAYAPMVDMRGVDPVTFAADVATCRDAATKVRVIRQRGETSDVTDAFMIGVGIVVPFGFVSMAVVSTLWAAIDDPMDPAGKPADAALQQSTLLNCMARKGYRNTDPLVTVRYVAPPVSATESPVPRPGGRDLFVAERVAESMLCPQGPARGLLEDKGPGFERYRVACGNGMRVVMRCEFGNCTAESTSMDVALGR